MPDTDARGAVSSAAEMRGRPAPDDPRKPDSPTDLHPVDWRFTLRSTLREFGEDGLTDLAAALTYYAVLSLFPGLIALVSILALFGFRGTAITDLIAQLAAQGVLPAESVKSLTPVLDGILAATPAPGLGLVLGILTAAWAASNYVKGFGRAMNRIYEVQEGRPGWKLTLQLYALTLVLLALLGVAIMLVVVSGPITQSLGALFGAPPWLRVAFDWVKLPVLALVVVLILALLYHFTPNVRQPKMRWISVGAVVAILVAAVASVLFGLYLGFAGNRSYANTYGTLAGVIIFLFWLWVMNTALLFGGELDAELERARELRAGLKAEKRIQLPPRETTAAEKADHAAAQQVAEGRRIRLSAGRGEGANGGEPGFTTDSVAAERVRGSDHRRPTADAGEPAKKHPDRKRERRAERRPDSDRELAASGPAPAVPRGPLEAPSWMEPHEAAVARKAKLDRAAARQTRP